MNVINGTCSVTGYSFADNTSKTDGGAIRSQAVLKIKDCTFARNIAGVSAGRGGAIYMTGSGKLTLAGTGSFTDNKAKNYGNAISFKGSSTGTATGASYTYGTNQTVTDASDKAITLQQ